MNLDIWLSIGVNIKSELNPFESDENWVKIANLVIEKILKNPNDYINLENIDVITEWED